MAEDILGKRFGRLVVLSFVGKIKNRGTIWNCACDCGNTKHIGEHSLRSGSTSSCGCYSMECKTKHGGRGTPEYKIWESMKQRCTNPKHAAYKNYGGRGISVCDEWSKSFKAFFDNVGKRPDGHVIDRIDNNRGYEPGNCRWVTYSTSNKNRRPQRRRRKSSELAQHMEGGK